MSEMRLVVVGAAGRMGRMLIKAVAETGGCRLVGAIEREGSPALGQDAGLLAGAGPLGVTVTDDPLPVFAQADGVLDFTAPDGDPRLCGSRGPGPHRACDRHHRSRRSRFDQAEGRRPPCAHRPVRQHEPRREPACRPRAQVAATLGRGLRHRDPRDASPHEGRRALRHRAAPRRAPRRRGAGSSLSDRARCAAATATPARGRPRRHRLRDPARRLGGRRPHGDLRRRGRAHRARRTAPRTATSSPAAPSGRRSGPSTRSPGFTPWPTCSASTALTSRSTVTRSAETWTAFSCSCATARASGT